MFRHGGANDDEKGARHAPLRAVPRSLSSFIGGFKGATTREFRAMTGDPDGALWQRGYYEHVVRDERDFARIGDYIAHNPMNWQFDQENMGRSS
jgi:REP element-mobilizing transposase RayT